MHKHVSVLTLNCWGLSFSFTDKKDRIQAIGTYLSDPDHGYDIVGLQEVWVLEDVLTIQNLVKDVFPFTMHWTSGLFGSGLVMLSKYRVKSTSLRRFTLNGNPVSVLHGDWYDGKSCASVVLEHPTVGEIEVFNTHLHATYDPIGTTDAYLGCRLAQAWEMTSLVRTAIALGRHVIALGDFNSAPNSLVIQLLTQFGGLTDSWGSLHRVPSDSVHVPKGLLPEQGVALLGITCDSPLNSWTSHSTWKNALTGDPIGERLDYILFKQTLTMNCSHVQVVLQEKTVGGLVRRHGTGRKPSKHVSDHFGVHATFRIKARSSERPDPNYQICQEEGKSWAAGGGGRGKGFKMEEKEDEKLMEQVLNVLEQELRKTKATSRIVLTMVTPLLFLATLGAGMMLGSLCMDLSSTPFSSRWPLVVVTIVLSVLSSAWMLCLGFGFLYGGETVAAFVNVIQEVELALQIAREQGYRSTDHL